jgi:hypothetical protein
LLAPIPTILATLPLTTLTWNTNAYPRSFVGKDFLEFLSANSFTTSRSQGLEFGRKLVAVGIFEKAGKEESDGEESEPEQEREFDEYGFYNLSAKADQVFTDLKNFAASVCSVFLDSGLTFFQEVISDEVSFLDFVRDKKPANQGQESSTPVSG